MRKVYQLVGRDAGRIVELPYPVASACVAAGSAVWPEDVDKIKMRGAPKPEAPAGELADPAPIVPADWESLHWTQKVKLAQEVSGEDNIRTKDEAEAILRGHAPVQD